MIENTEGPRIVICGSRYWADAETIAAMLRTLPPNATIIHGACRGADLIASAEATVLGLNVIALPARWQEHGNRAGPIRNTTMLALDVDVVWAFHDDLVASKGTADIVKKARRKGIPVAVVHSEMKGRH